MNFISPRWLATIVLAGKLGQIEAAAGFTFTASNLGRATPAAPLTTVQSVVVDPARTYQTIEGLGGATAFYDGWVPAHPYALEIYTNAFAGLNLSMLRLGNWYRYQTPLAGFDSAASSIVSNANRILGRPVPVFMSSWAPPAFLKSNGQTANGGTLVFTNGGFAYTNFAQYWYDSINAYQSNGVALTWLSIQNEPDWAASYDSCVFYPNEETVKGTNYASYSKALDATDQRLANLPAPPKILAPECVGIGYNDVQNFAATMHSNSFYGVTHHLYGGSTDGTPDGYIGALEGVTNVFPSKPHFMTEFGYGDMLQTACLLHDCLTIEQVSGFNYWSLIWPVGGNGLVQIENPYNRASWTNAPPGVTTQSHGWWLTPSFWAMKHFSYFISPGFKRVFASDTDDNVRASAFLSPDGLRLVVVLINTNASAASAMKFDFGAFNVGKSSVYQTAGTNTYAGTNAFMALGALANPQVLPPQSITTLVLDQLVAVAAAGNPCPSNGAAGVALNSPLSWTPGSNALMHALYLGIDSNAVAQAVPGSPPFQGLLTATNLYPSLFGAKTCFWRVDEIAGINTNAGAVWEFGTAPSPALLHRYSFNETGGTNTADAVGGPAWAGTLPNGGAFSNGQLAFSSASSQFVSLPPGLVSGLTNFSVLTWVQLASTANWARVFDFGNNTTVYMYLAPQNGNTGTPRYALTTNSAGAEQQINCNAVLTTGVRHQLAVTLNGHIGVLYLDGLPAGTNSAMMLNPAVLGGTSHNYLGKSQWSDPYLDGSIDEFRVYTVALSAAEVAATYALGPNELLSTNPPVAALATAGTALTLSWPLASAGFVLQVSTNLASGRWTTLAAAMPQVAGTNYQLTLPATNAVQFFRLSK